VDKLTTAFGAPVPDDDDTMTEGPRGPALLQDVWFLEKMARFDREVIPERRMHAKGAAAFGTFTITHDTTHYTRAKLFQKWARRPIWWLGFPRLPVSAVLQTPSATFADLP